MIIRLIYLLLPMLALCSSPQIDQVIKLPALPDEIDFAGESLPLNYFDVRESLQRELMIVSHLHASTTYIIQLDNRYRDEIVRILNEEGLHSDFYYLCIAESALQPLVSPANAAGYWQFLATTAREYGLVVDSEVDERYNIEKSTRAAASYFKKAKAEFGNWTLAAASYNIGITNIRNRVGYQSLTNYYDMQFPEETGRYLFRALAFKILLENPSRFGFMIESNQLFKPLEYREVTVKGKIENWSDFALEHGTNFKLLKIYNQWIRSNSMNNKQNRSYKVRVPTEGFREH